MENQGHGTVGGMAHVTKKEIVKQIAERANLTQLQTKEIVQWTFDAIVETLVTEGRIELRNFGVFEVKRRKPRRARNPRTNEPVEVEAKNVVTFQPGKIMEERVRQMKTSSEPKRKPRKNSRASESDEGEDHEEVVVGAGAPMNGTAGANHTLVDGTTGAPLKPR
ncbi:DNA-binding protein [Fimbriiglobus ruber]|uniref:DNA-binding protein n=1 Tax=Fimbriiglobus ruber TaxID=1908690 RepID=A0A225EFJ7_9BACT|nr:DNA-binding protein [Fimbriiglobus ruber]